MKLFIGLILSFLMLASISYGQAILGIYPWKLDIKIVDDAGVPIVNANVSVGYGATGSGKKIDGFTDKNGGFMANHRDRSLGLGIDVQKLGYYSSHINYTLFTPGQFDSYKVSTNRNSSLVILLKKKKEPIPMYVSHFKGPLPDTIAPVGYDLQMGDWVAPYGKGLVSDMVFKTVSEGTNENDFDSKIFIDFPGKGNGIQVFYAAGGRGNGSRLRSTSLAPIDGYQPELVRSRSHHPGQAYKEDMFVPGVNYYFRIRTILDADGNIKSAMYGKIYGDFMYCDYYLNPDANSRDLEFDEVHNLVKKYPPWERFDP